MKNYSKKTIVFFIPQTSLSERHQSKAMTGKNELVQDKYIYFTINGPGQIHIFHNKQIVKMFFSPVKFKLAVFLQSLTNHERVVI